MDTINTLGAWAGSLTAILCLGVYFLRYIMRPLRRSLTEIGKDMQVLRGSRAEYDASGHLIKEAVPSVEAFMLETNKNLEIVSHEMQYNSGLSIKDASRKQGMSLERLEASLSRHLQDSERDRDVLNQIKTHYLPKEK